MKLARLTCPGCHKPYERAVERDAYFVECPTCGQNNYLPKGTEQISGCCPNCSRALDDHIWQGTMPVHCP